MLRAGIILLGFAGIAILLIVCNVVQFGMCSSEGGGFCALIILICIPTGTILLLASGIRAAWRRARHPQLHHSH
jgi:hypothetical protein